MSGAAEPYGEFAQLRAERRGDGVVLVTLDAPERRNAMSEAMTESWGRLMAALRADRELRCVVVTGAGGAFCSGGDFGWIGSTPDATVDALRERMLPFYRTWLAVGELEVPTVAAIGGAAIGAGLALALACDLRYAAEDAALAAPFTALGMHSGMATSWLLPQAVGLGLVNQVFPRERLLDEALAVAARVAAAAPVATRLTKVALADGGHASYAAALQWEALAQPVTMATDDLQEGLRAAKEKRTPRFTGR
jgi:enoyl-CoA hydratase